MAIYGNPVGQIDVILAAAASAWREGAKNRLDACWHHGCSSAPMRMRSTPKASSGVTIFSQNPETLDGLETYLRSVGIQAKGRRSLEDCSDLTAASTLAIVLFPDDFPWETVVATIAEITGRCPSTLRVLVTAHPQQYERLVEGRANVVVVPRPVWGWTILDAIRSHAEAGESHGRGQVTS